MYKVVERNDRYEIEDESGHVGAFSYSREKAERMCEGLNDDPQLREPQRAESESGIGASA